MSLTLIKKGNSRAAVRLGFSNIRTLDDICCIYAADEKQKTEIRELVQCKQSFNAGQVWSWYEFVPGDGWEIKKRFNKSNVKVPKGWVR